MEELAEILGEELALPRIEPRGQKNIVTEKDKYTSIRSVGPESLRHFKRTYKRALKRQIAAGTYDPDRPGRNPGPRGQAVPQLEGSSRSRTRWRASST